MAKSEIVVESRQRQLEATISKALQSYVVVGTALAELKTIVPYGSFESRCEELWEMSPKDAQRQMKAAQVVSALEATHGSPPSNERQARELVPLLDQPELLSKTWKDLVGSGEKITAAVIKKYVDLVLAPPEDEEEDEEEDSEEEDDSQDSSVTEEDDDDDEDESESDDSSSDPEDEDDEDDYDDDTTPFKKACKALSNKYHSAGLSLLETSKMCEDERDVKFVSIMIDVLITQLEGIKKNLKTK